MVREYMVNATGAYLEYSPFFPNPIVCFLEIFAQLSTEIPTRLLSSTGTSSWLKETWEWHYSAFYIGRTELFHIMCIAFGLTFLRITLNKLILQRLPRWFSILEHDAKKFPESAWKFLVYSFTWSWTFYLCVISEQRYLFYNQRHWNEWILGVSVPTGVYWIYMFEMGFYVHCVYASVFLETIRKDFVLLMLHHFLTFGLLSYSYGVRYHAIGLLVLFLHDFGDVMLELSKCFVYLKTRKGVECKITDFISNVSFGIFLLEWVLLRLYWFLVKVLYSTAVVNTKFYENGGFYLSFNIMLAALYLMQVYWFYLILKVVHKILMGEGVKDTRETKEEVEVWEKAMKQEKETLIKEKSQ